MLIKTDKGLYCQAGDFYIDPCRAVDHAVITHAHSDHARRGSKHYYCVNSGVDLLKARLGQKINVSTYHYQETFKFQNVLVSFHPAGHILGSCQVRIEHDGEVWVVSGDYKRDDDPTCEVFETVECDVFISEATFGTPNYVWDKNQDHGADIYGWWQQNAKQGLNSILFAYSLGKAQRILGNLAQFTEQPIICHTPTENLNKCYRAQGIKLATSVDVEDVDLSNQLQGELFLVPTSFLKSEAGMKIGKRFRTAFASGWMTHNYGRYDKGFTMSDHADWNDLINTIIQTKAQRVYVQHRGTGALVKELKHLGIKAFSDDELVIENTHQMALF